MKNQFFIRVLKYSIITLIFFLIFKYLYVNINSINLNDIEFNYFYLFISVVIYFFHILFNGVVWYAITKQNNCEINFFDTIRARIYADMGKYIPGKVFTYGILMYTYEQKGISKKKIMICSFQELITSFLGPIVISLGCIYFSNINELNNYKNIFIVLLIVCFVAVHPKILQYVSNYILTLFKKETISVESSYGKITYILVLVIFSWLIFGCSFYFFINSFYKYSLQHYFFTTGAFAISSLAGFLAVFAPGGLGVREGMLIFTLSFIFPTAITALISLISRIWMTLCELLLLLIIYSLSYFVSRSKKKPI